MSKILLRVTKRKAAWEPSASPEETLRTEFRTPTGEIDLRPSVYEIRAEHPQVVRAHAEHAASAGLDPPRGGTNVNLSQEIQTVIRTLGDTKFEFTREAHRELVFQDEQELLSFVREVLAAVEHRGYSTSKQDLLAYVKERLEVSDAEWETFCGTSPKGARWRSAALKAK